LLRHASESALDDFLRVIADHGRDWSAFDAITGLQAGKRRRFENAEPDVEPDADQHDAECKGQPPTPDQEFVAGDLAEGEYREIGQEQPAWDAELGPGGDESA